MAPSTSINWDVDETSALVSIGDRNLFLRAQGPPRVKGQPVVVVEVGAGDHSRSWSAVSSLVSKFARIYTYDRAGAGESKAHPGPDPRTAAVMAADLAALLSAAKIEGPYVVACHSYGGLIAREFLALQADDIAAMIFVDTNTERTSKEIDLASVMPAFEALAGEVDYYEVTGLNRDQKLDPEAWASVKGDSGASEQERSGEAASVSELAVKKQFELQVMRDKPVVVIRGNVPRDMRLFYEAALEKGSGSEEDRAKILKGVERLEEKDEGLQREQLKLSIRGRFVQAEKSGHNVQITEPELVAGEIEKLLIEIKG
jgi:pimeloyl-ACP methyl ester carboxylesterase